MIEASEVDWQLYEQFLFGMGLPALTVDSRPVL